MRERECVSRTTHLTGALASMLALVMLVVAASRVGTVWHVVSFSVFGASLILLYTASTLYHLYPLSPRTKNILQRIDHSMIYVLIAGTYTPILLVPLRGGWGWSLFGVLWGFAVLGIVWKSMSTRSTGKASMAFYIGMGWILVIALVPLLRVVPLAAVGWILVGGVFYTAGAVCLAYEKHIRPTKWIGMHEIFHIFVLLGSASHVWLMWHYILYVP